VLFHTWVAHGKNSGELVSNQFSNDRRSLQSSIGVFSTNETYIGQHGYSLRVQGLEPGFNDNAYKRNIVFHGASYVSEEVATHQKRLGRSWGCFAVNEKELSAIVKTIKDKTIVVAYYPDKNWLAHSSYLQNSVYV
jgi:L,D-transpeptidase catalytic domain